jgi:signal transduction histidine kinase
VLDDLGLVASLRALCRKFSEHEGVSVHFHSGELPSAIPREAASCLYRVVQESLQNIARHSGAKRVSVSISVKKNALAVSITDDGSGFELEEARGRGGLGLIGMEERTRLANGKLSITARKGHGTRISVAVPLQAGVT